MSKEQKFAKYRNFPPAKVLSSKMVGHKVYLYLSWDNVKGLSSKWVRAKECDFYTPASKEANKPNINTTD